jgi:hypothetical protein
MTSSNAQNKGKMVNNDARSYVDQISFSIAIYQSCELLNVLQSAHLPKTESKELQPERPFRQQPLLQEVSLSVSVLAFVFSKFLCSFFSFCFEDLYSKN